MLKYTFYDSFTNRVLYKSKMYQHFYEINVIDGGKLNILCWSNNKQIINTQYQTSNCSYKAKIKMLLKYMVNITMKNFRNSLRFFDEKQNI